MAPSVTKTLSLILAISIVSLNANSIPLGARRSLLAGETVFDVTTLGVKPDGTTDNTQTMIKAWNTACKAPGSTPRTLLFPAGDFLCGEIVFQGPCNGPITVDIKGTLIGSDDLSVYTRGVWIEIEDIKDVTVTGGGTIDGKGEKAWKFAPENKGASTGGTDSLLPVSLQYSHVTKGSINNIKILNSKGFHSKVTYSTDVTVTDMDVVAPGDSPNTDGLHISSSSNVNVTNFKVATGDDCISIGEGNTNVFISKVTCGPGHGISVGSLGKRPDEKSVSGVTIENCTLTGTTNGARIKTYHDSPKLTATGITFENIVMNHVENPIIIDQHYASKVNPKPSNVQLSGVVFKNIRGTSATPMAVTLNCSEAVPCGVELADINLTPAKAGEALSGTCFNAKETVVGTQSVKIPACGVGA